MNSYNHPIAVVTSIIRNFKKWVFLFLIIFINNRLYGELAILGALLVFSIYGYFNWKRTFFYIEDKNLIYNSGVFSIKRKVIPLEKIITVDFTQSILSRFFKLYKVKLDTGSKDIAMSELDILLRVDQAEDLKAAIFADGTSGNHDTLESGNEIEENFSDTNSEKAFMVSMGTITLKAITGNFILIGLGALLSFYAFFDDIVSALDLKIDLFDNAEKYVETASRGDFFTILYTVITIILPFVFIALFFSIVGTNIRYYGFTIKRSGNKIHIEYGLLSKKKYTIPVDGINAVTLQQNLFRRLIKMNSIEASTAGYGDEKNEEALLFPLAGEKLTAEILNAILPDVVYSGELKRPPRRAASMFFFKPIFLYACMVLIGSIFKIQIAYALFLIPVIALANFLEYKNSGIGFDSSRVALAYGAFSYKRVIIPFSKVQVLSKKVSIFQKRKNLCTYIFEFYSGKIGASATVKHLGNEYFSDLMENQINT